MDEFYMFLIIGLLTIAAMLVLLVGDLAVDFGTGSGIDYGGNRHTYRTTTTYRTDTTIIPAENEMLVGPQNVETWRSIKLGEINTSYLSAEKSTKVDYSYIYNGLLFGKTALAMGAEVDIGNFVGSFLRFTVDKYNGYGNLLIKFNDVTVANRKFEPGAHTIIIDKSLVNYTNRVEFIPSSSTWKLWAPNVYGIKDAEFVYQSHFAKSTSVSFNVYQEEASSLKNKMGRMVLDLDEHKGSLKVMLNGNEIFSGSVSGYQGFYFSEAGLRLGSNTVDFISEDNGDFLGTATMLIYYDTSVENEAEYDFVLNRTRYDTLDTSRGIISFNLTRVIRTGGYSMSIIDGYGDERMLAYDQAAERKISYYFNTSYCSVGKNTVRIRSIDGSVFYVKDLSVKI